MSSIINFIVGIAQFVTGIFYGMKILVKLIVKAVIALPSYLGFFGSMAALIFFILCVAVVARVLGREG